MDQNSGNKKKWIALIIFLILLLLFLFWFFFSGTKPKMTTDTSTTTSFDPFNRPTTNRVVDARSPDVTYVHPPQAVAVPEGKPIPTVYTAPPEPFISYEPAYRQSFAIPQKTTSAPSAPLVYSETPANAPPPTYISYATPTYQPVTAPSTTVSVLITNTTDPKKGFNELDKEIFGYVSGLGWTQLLGKTGQQVFDFLYLLTPQGSTGATLGKLLGVGGGSSGGISGVAGFGAGGSSLLEFGGMVSNVTYCTCSDSIMLDINDVRGQMLSLIYQAGVTKLYSNYNVYGTGQNVLGNYVTGGTCLVESGPDCNSQGNPSGTMTQIGTSIH